MIYSLHIDRSRLSAKEDSHDVRLIRFPGFESVLFFAPDIDDQAWGAPNVVEFIGDLEVAAQVDHLATSPVPYLLVSRRMIQTLQSVAPFRCQLFPTIIYSPEIGDLVRDKYNGTRTSYAVNESTLRNDNFVILKLLDILDCLDHERTLVCGVPYSRCDKKRLSDLPPDIPQFAFRKPDGGFPPVFYVPELLFYCYSEEAKQACERAGLKGLRFEPLP